MASDRLVISLLGPPEIKVGDKVLHIHRRMFRYFIFYLACQQSPVSRESLCELFWPEEDESKSRKNLREVISKIRHDLPVEDLILTEKEYVSFNQAKVEVDVLKFEETISLLRRNLDQVAIGRLTDQVYKTVQESLNLWRNDRFLGGVSTSGSGPFQLWVSNTGENLQYWRQMMIEWLADRCIVAGDLSEALTWLSLARLSDPGNAEIDLLLLTCLRDLGLWSRAMNFCEVLEKQYNTDGEKALPVSIKDLIAHVRQDASDLHTPVLMPSSLVRERQRPFVGRASYLNQLELLLNRGGILLLKGAAGSGKTSLLREYYENLDVQPFFLYHCAKPGDEAMPYYGMVEGVRKLIPEAFWKQIDRANASALAALFPEAEKYRHDQKSSLDSAVEIDRRIISEAFHDLVSRANRKKKSLLIIDNAQWLDADSLEVILYLYDHVSPDKVSAIVFACRDDAIDGKIEEMLSRRLINRPFEIMKLHPLNATETAEVYSRNFGREPSPELIEQLVQLSGGNPRLLQTLLNCIAEENLPGESDSLDPADLLTDEVVKAVREALENIDEAGLNVLKSLAILNEPFSPMMIERMTGLPGETLLGILGALEKCQLLEWAEDDAGFFQYKFTRQIIAEYFRNSVNPLERRQLHLQAAQVIIDCEGDGNSQAASLAWHFQEAGDFRKAFKYWILAGTFEKEKLHKHEAYQFYQKALVLIERLGNQAGSDDIYHLVDDWGDLALQVDDMTTFANLNSICLRAGETRSDSRLIGYGKSGLGWVAHSRGYLDLAVGFLTQAIEIFKQINDKISLMDAYFRLGTIYFVQQDYAKVINYYDEVMKLSLTLQSSDAMSFYKKATAFLVFANCIAGHMKIARMITDQGSIISQTLGEENYSTQLRAAEAISLYYMGDLENARKKIEEVLPAVNALKLDWWTFTLLSTAGQTAMEEGNLTDCWKIGEAITKPQSLLINPDWGSFYERYLRGELLLSLGDLDNAERYYRANLGQPPDKFIKWISTLGMAKVEMRRGKFKTCRQTLEAIAQESADSGFELIVQGARAELIRLSLYQEDPQSITKIFMHYGPSIKQSEYKGIRILAAVLEGRGYLQQGKIEEAKKHLSRALEEARESRYFWLHLDALKSLIEAGVDQEANRKEAKRMILQAEFNCEIPELSKALEDYKKRWR